MIAGATNVFAWDADKAPWDTLTVTVTLNASTISSTQVNDAGVDECAWLVTYTQGGTATKVFTFYREDPAFDDFIQTVNKWALVRGIINAGGGSYALTKAAQGDTGDIGSTIRTVYTQACGSGGPDGVLNFSDSTTYTNNWSRVSVFNGAGVEGDCTNPYPDDSGSDAKLIGCNLTITQSDNSLAIVGDALFNLHEFTVGEFSGLTTVQDTDFTTPITITVEDFKASGVIDFGSTQSGHFVDPGGYDTFDIHWSIGFTCS